MKKQLYLLIPLLAFLLLTPTTSAATVNTSTLTSSANVEKTIKKALKGIPEVKSVEEMDPCDHFEAYFEIWYEQPTDPANPESETFLQRVLLGHSSFDAPVIVELQGYEIHSRRAGELAHLFNGNQLTIEHRYFADSKPESGIPWETLTVENAALDQHKIINAIKTALYADNKFLSTGISKGGQTTMIHRSLYPEDVDASVCYVAPLNFEREDPRIYSFLKQVSTAENREKVHNFQVMCFERKDTLIQLLEETAAQKGYNWDFDITRAFELYTLEYSFAFWQWGAYSVDQIPGLDASHDKVLNHLLKVSGVSFFEQKGVETLRPFFWAALTQMGMYGYEYEPFKNYLSQQSDYTFDFTFPKGQSGTFNGDRMKAVNTFIQEKAETMLFIYGELDTWSATAVNLGDTAKDNGLKKYVLNGGHHGTRIRHFEADTRKEIKATLNGWLGLSE